MARATLQLKLQPGAVIAGRYTVVKKLGEGGCGSVYRCTDARRDGHDVAVKILENPGELARFKRERKVMAANGKMPHVVQLLDAGTHDRHPFLVMEYMAGGSLRDYLDTKKKLPAEEAAWILVQAIRGLRRAGTVHRDLKPDNLLIGRALKERTVRFQVPREGEPGVRRGASVKGAVVKVADFGLAKRREMGDTVLTNTGQIMGTPLYMSPEQCRNTRDVGESSDIYALGVMFYEMIIGKPPFDADSAYDLMTLHCNEPVPYPRNLDPEVQTVLERCLRKKPEERYRGLLQLEKALSQIAGIGDPLPDPRRWTLWIILIGMATFLALAWVLRDRIGLFVEKLWKMLF